MGYPPAGPWYPSGWGTDAYRLPAPSLAPAPPVEVAATDSSPSWFAEVSVLSWQIQDAPIPFPLDTVQDLTNTIFGQASPQPLPGAPTRLSFERGLGGRLLVGMWVDRTVPIGAEVGGFGLLDQTAVATIVPPIPTDLLALNLPLLTMPLPTLPVPIVGGAATPPSVSDLLRGLSSGITVESVTGLWSAEANGLWLARSGDCVEFVALAGVRHLGLIEALTLRNAATDQTFIQLLGPGTELGNKLTNESRFFGGQVGGRFTVTLAPVYFGITGKVALGTTEQTRDLAGSLFQLLATGLSPGTILGAVSAPQQLVERRTVREFAVANEVNVRAGFCLGSCVRIFGGYDFLYWSRVARAGDQFDRLPDGGQLLGSGRPDRPVGIDFYAHGFSVGAEVRY
jgi:hypothetical protein